MYVYIYIICIELHMKRMSHSIYDAPNQFHWFFLECYSVTHQAMIQIDLQTYLGEEHLGSDMEKMNTPHRWFTIQWGLVYGNYVQQKPVFCTRTHKSICGVPSIFQHQEIMMICCNGNPCHIVETNVSIKCSQFVEMGTEKLCFRTCCPEESALKKPDIYSSMINMFFLFTKK